MNKDLQLGGSIPDVHRLPLHELVRPVEGDSAFAITLRRVRSEKQGHLAAHGSSPVNVIDLT